MGIDPDKPCMINFDFPIYFSEAEFKEQVDFSRCTFKSTFSVSGATFRKDVSFLQTIKQIGYDPQKIVRELAQVTKTKGEAIEKRL